MDRDRSSPRALQKRVWRLGTNETLGKYLAAGKVTVTEVSKRNGKRIMKSPNYDKGLNRFGNRQHNGCLVQPGCKKRESAARARRKK